MSENKNSQKKSVLLRIDMKTWSEIEKWADEEYRSVNGQIEYLLSTAVSKRRESKDKNEKH